MRYGLCTLNNITLIKIIIIFAQIKIVAEDQETAEYAQHRLPDITPVETVTNIFLHPISIISMLMWTIKFVCYRRSNIS